MEAVIRCRSRAAYHSRRSFPALPRVRTPGRAHRATRSVIRAMVRLRPTGPGTARSVWPSGVRPPTSKAHSRGPAVTCQRELAAAPASGTWTWTGTSSTSSKV
ncbi:hypothetical protein ACFFX0_13885 [Citricoccus parietis]|uniref:Uncharacterized protein n=1 Tax=Citricoccus parietis TaxID=592307 RepID=A0ABV5FZW2_9MICC